MKKLLILGTSIGSVEIVQTAKEMGYYTIVTDNLNPELSIAKKAADEYWMISTHDVDCLESKCRKENVNAVFAGISEYNLDRMKELTKRLGLPCYIEDASWKYARDKSEFKKKCREVGIPVVDEYELSNPPLPQELAQIEYPVVVKPVDGSGNKGLSICYSEEEVVAGCRKARQFSNSPKILVERYIIGEETWNFYYLAEGESRYIYSGRVFRQPGYPTYLYSFGSSATADTREFGEQMNDKCIAFLKDIGCKNGIAWFQFIKDQEGRYYALEMAQRMSAGTPGRTMKKAVGINAIEWVLETAFGVQHTVEMLPKACLPPFYAAHCVYCQFADREGVIRSLKGYEMLDPQKIQVNIVTHEGSYVEKYRLMVRITFVAKNGQEMCDILREINEKTSILCDSGENMYIRYTDYEHVLESHKGLFLHE